MKDVKVEVRFKNARLLAAIEERWGKVIDQVQARQKRSGVRPLMKVASELSGVSYPQLCGLLTMRLVAYREKSGVPTESAKKLSEALDMEPRELFPPRLCSSKLGPVYSYLEEAELMALSAKLSSVQELRHDIALELTGEVDALLELLEPRQEKTIRLRFGVGGMGEHTLLAIGEELGVCRARAAQIEAAALRKLRDIAGRTNKRLGRSLREILGQLGT